MAEIVGPEDVFLGVGGLQLQVGAPLPKSCVDLAQSLIRDHRKPLPFCGGLGGLHGADEVAGIDNVNGKSVEIARGAFGLRLPQRGQHGVPLPREAMLEVGIALSVTNQDQSGHKESFLLRGSVEDAFSQAIALAVDVDDQRTRIDRACAAVDGRNGHRKRGERGRIDGIAEREQVVA